MFARRLRGRTESDLRTATQETVYASEVNQGSPSLLSLFFENPLIK